MKQIKIKIGLDGSVEVDALGFKGQGCKAATKPIEEALGMVAGSKPKPEIHVHETQNQQQTNTW